MPLRNLGPRQYGRPCFFCPGNGDTEGRKLMRRLRMFVGAAMALGAVAVIGCGGGGDGGQVRLLEEQLAAEEAARLAAEQQAAAEEAAKLAAEQKAAVELAAEESGAAGRRTEGRRRRSGAACSREGSCGRSGAA